MPEMTRLSSVPATYMVCELTRYVTKCSVDDGLVLSVRVKELRVPLLVVPSPPTDSPLPETTTLVKRP